MMAIYRPESQGNQFKKLEASEQERPMMQPKSEVEGLKFTLESHWGKSPFKG
jgi:hypothetical protein